MGKVKFKEKRDFSEVINATFGFIKQEFSPLLKILMFTVAPIALAVGIVIHFLINFVMDIAKMSNNPEFTSFSWVKTLIVNMGIGFVTFIIASITVAAVVLDYIKVYVDERPKKNIEIKDIWKWLKLDFWRILFAAVFLTFVSLFIQIFVNILPLIGMLIYVVISIFITAITYLTYMIMVYERKGVFSSLSRSFDLITDFWWVSFGIVAVASVIQWSLTVSVAMPSIVAYGVYIYHSVKSIHEVMVYNSPFLNIVSAVFTVLSTIFVFMLQSIALVAIAFHYFNLVEHKEGPGLMEKIQLIGTNRLEDEDSI